MKPLTKAINDYLALRRSLGFKLHGAGRVLAKFASFMEQQSAECITTQLALDWRNVSMTLRHLDEFI